MTFFKQYRINRLKIKIMQLETEIKECEYHLTEMMNGDWTYYTTPYDLSNKKVRLEVSKKKLDILTNS